MATEVLEPTSIATSRIPTLTFQTSEQWHRSLPAKQQLQLTSRNLRDLGATLKLLDVPGQTPRASPSPSESSSDSESNHRIYRSTKRVCMREDMNTTREISPRPTNPTAIVVPEAYVTSKAKWTNPDTPAPWLTEALRHPLGEFDEDASVQGSKSRGKGRGVVIQLNGLSLSPPGSTIAVSSSSATNIDAIERTATATRRLRFYRSSRGNGIGIARRSHFALPRPQSLPKPRSLSFGCSPQSLAQGPSTEDDLIDCLLGGIQTPKKLSYLSAGEPPSNYNTGGSTKRMPETLTAGISCSISASSTPGLIGHVVQPKTLPQPRTYVDHVRAQRLPPNGVQSRISTTRAQAGYEVSQQRRMSV